MTYRKNDTISNAVNAWANNNEPIYDFVSDSVKQTVWKIDDENTINLISGEFDKISALYIADGHHRCASAVKVGQKGVKKSLILPAKKNSTFSYLLLFLMTSLKLWIITEL